MIDDELHGYDRADLGRIAALLGNGVAQARQVDQGRLDHATAAKIKLFVSEAAYRATEQAIRVLGGAGMMREYGVGRHHRDAMVYLFGEGTSDIQRNLIAGLLGL